MKTNRSLPLKLFVICTMCIGLQLSNCINVATGNSSETTNVAIVTFHHKPAAFAKVKFIDADDWAFLVANNISPVIDSATADEHGNVRFQSIPNGTCNLQIDHDKGCIVIRNYCNDGEITFNSDTIGLPVAAKLKGVVESNTATSVLLEGTAYSVSLDSNRSFVLPKVAPGYYPVLVQSSSGSIDISKSAGLFPGSHVDLDTIKTVFDSLMMDDFEDLNMVTIPGQLTVGNWYTSVDAINGGTSKITQQIVPKNIYGGGWALRADIVLNYRIEGAWAISGFDIGNVKKSWDLSKMEAISFQAKGSGKIRVSLHSELVHAIDDWPHFGYVFALDTSWKSYRIPVDSLKLSVGFNVSEAAAAGITWKDAAKTVTRIEFEASSIHHNLLVENVTFWIDNIMIEGMSASDLFIQMESEKGK